MSGNAKGGNNVLIAGDADASASVRNDMWGDAQTMLGTAIGGKDTFEFVDNIVQGGTVGTKNYIEDFSQHQHDSILFSGVAGVTGFSNLSFDTTTTPGSTIIHAGADQVTLVHFTGALTSADFKFA